MFRKTLFVLLTFAAIPVYAEDLLEPCINGEVSASGNFPNQEMEEQVFAYLDWQSDEPYYYLFQVASQEIATTYSEN